jgi:hypothetical protein
MARSSIETSPRPVGSDRSHADLTDHVWSGSIFKPAAERSRKNYICEHVATVESDKDAVFCDTAELANGMLA